MKNLVNLLNFLKNYPVWVQGIQTVMQFYSDGSIKVIIKEGDVYTLPIYTGFSILTAIHYFNQNEKREAY